MTATINNHTYTFNLPTENAVFLWSMHGLCTKYGRHDIARRIEQEAAKRPLSERVIMKRLGYKPQKEIF